VAIPDREPELKNCFVMQGVLRVWSMY